MSTTPPAPQPENHPTQSQHLQAAWRAAGSPPEVIFAIGETGGRPMLAAPWRRHKRIVDATPEQAEAWRAWKARRIELAREIDERESP
jgi:hypothetical protein